MINTYNNVIRSGKNEVIEFLRKCHLDQYVNVFIEEGFDTMDAVSCVSSCSFCCKVSFVFLPLSDKRRIITK